MICKTLSICFVTRNPLRQSDLVVDMEAEVLPVLRAGTVPPAAEPCWDPEAAGSLPPCLFPLPIV